MRYNTNGGSIDAGNQNGFSATSSGMIQNSSGDVTTIVEYGDTQTFANNGLWDDESFGMNRTGYRFIGWSLVQDGHTNLIDQNDGVLSGEVIYPDLKDGDAEVILYAMWEKDDPQYDFIIPARLMVVEEEAFVGSKMVSVKCPETLKRIKKRAFAECLNLKKIYIPESTHSIAKDAFEDSPKLLIYGMAGSYAEFYAGKYGYQFVVVEEE